MFQISKLFKASYKCCHPVQAQCFKPLNSNY